MWKNTDVEYRLGQFGVEKFFFLDKINYICSEKLNLNEMFNLKL